MADELLVSQLAAHELLEGFIAELSAINSSSSLRARIAASFQTWLRAPGVLFLEPCLDGGYLCTLAINATTANLGARQALARWLRVNNEVLIVRDRPEVLAYLGAEERQYLNAHSIGVCVPLVWSGRLVAILMLVDPPAGAAQTVSRTVIESGATRAAEVWQRVLHAERVEAERDAMGHNHRLGIAGQLAASVAHEVRNPLAAIRSLVQFTKDTSVPDEDRRSILEDVLAEVDRIDQTVTGMLQLSQPTLSDQRTLDLSPLVKSVQRFVRAYANKQKVSIVLELDEKPVRISGDEREIRHLLTNLLLNACQACEGGGQITVTARVVTSSIGRNAELAVADTGPGIPPEHLPRVFESFFTTKPHGTGLGLPYCREVAERHGGTISVESAVGRGTRVQVQLPLLDVDEHTALS